MPCQGRGLDCRSQEFADDAPASAVQPERTVARRLGRLEEMMEALVGRMAPDLSRKPAAPSGRERSPSSSPLPEPDDGPLVDVLESSAADDTPVAAILGIQDVLTPASKTTPTPEIPGGAGHAPNSRLGALSRELHALFPCQDDVDAILRVSTGGPFVVYLFHSYHETLAGRSEDPSTVAVIPPASSHPIVLAKRLLQLALSIQQLSPAYAVHHRLQLQEPLGQVARKLVTAAHGVTTQDDLVASVEGLQCLVLLSLCEGNMGNLRKAWLTSRRALSLGQLMGINRGSERALKSCEPDADRMKRPSAAMLWYRINWVDRHLALLLGLPIGDASFQASGLGDDCLPMERLERLHVAITGRIVERNQTKGDAAFAMTRCIDCDLEAAARSMGTDWARPTALDPFAAPEAMFAQKAQAMHQINHHTLLILLHLPYLLRDPAENRYDHNKASCMRSSREVLVRFNAFRALVTSAFSCRHVDYAALIAAMTLVLGYLGSRPAGAEGAAFDQEREDDRMLVEKVRGRMEQVAVLNQDQLSQESADIVKRLLPVIEHAGTPIQEEGLRVADSLNLDLPYAGIVNMQHLALSGLSSPLQVGSASDGLPSHSVSKQCRQQDEALLSSGNLFGGIFAAMEREEPDLSQHDATAAADSWILQGVDTSYWSLLQDGVNFGP